MSKYPKIYAFSLISFFLLFSSLAQAQLSLQDLPVSVNGHVMDEAGQPVEFAAVTLIDMDSLEYYRGVTDASGRFPLSRATMK